MTPQERGKQADLQRCTCCLQACQCKRHKLYRLRHLAKCWDGCRCSHSAEAFLALDHGCTACSQTPSFVSVGHGYLGLDGSCNSSCSLVSRRGLPVSAPPPPGHRREEVRLGQPDCHCESTCPSHHLRMLTCQCWSLALMQAWACQVRIVLRAWLGLAALSRGDQR